MQRETTLDLYRRKLSTISALGIGVAPNPFDLDSYLGLRVGKYLYAGAYLRSAPSTKAIQELAEAGVPVWPLDTRGSVADAWAFLRMRERRGLAPPSQARRLAALGHPDPWSVLAIDFEEERGRLEINSEKSVPEGDETTPGLKEIPIL